MFHLIRIVCCLVVVCFFCPSVWAQAGQAEEPSPPRLVVLMVIDGLAQHQLLQAEGRMGKGGLSQILDRGAWFTNAHYGYAATFTAAGHATVATGAYPYRHGIIANDWMEGNRRVYCVEDAQHKHLGEATPEHGGTSPRNLQSWTLADHLRLATGSLAKVVAVSLKDRGAILPAGKTGTAYWYSSQSGRFVTSSYYRKDYPDWWQKFHRDGASDKWFRSVWRRSAEADVFPFAVPDGRDWQVDYKGFGTRFPFSLAGKADRPGPEYYSILPRTPFGDEYALEFAKAAVEGEGLGKNPGGVPDLLCVSLSAHDYINHAFGPESIQAFDYLVKLNGMLKEFLDFLNRSVGLGNVILAITADHGFAPSPEYLHSLQAETGRVDMAQLQAELNRYLDERFSEGPYVKAWWSPTFYLDRDRMGARKLVQVEVELEAARWLRSQPGIACVYTRTQIENGQLPDTQIARQITRSWHPLRSGDLFVVANPYWYLPSIPQGDVNAATHGSPHSYDTHVPIVLLGQAIKAGRYPGRVDVIDLVPTLAHLLSITPPDGAEGRVLTEALEE